jgi:Tol biopolymer transport system component
MRTVSLLAAGLVALSGCVLSAGAATDTHQPSIVYRSVRLASPQRPPDLYVVSPVGAGHRLLAQAADQPAWSPRRKRIAFAGASTGRQGIWVMNADGRGKRRLTRLAGDGEPTWSPDGSRIAFRRVRAGAFDLFVVLAAGGPVQRLFGGPETSELAPDWSPDGRWIAFQSTRGGSIQIWILNLRTRGVRRVTRGYASFSPDWSPDGRRIAYSTRGRIAIVGANGRGARLLRSGLPASAGNPAWSPDGRRIAFQRGGQVLTMRTDGSDRRYATRAAWGTNGAPDW